MFREHITQIWVPVKEKVVAVLGISVGVRCRSREMSLDALLL